MLLSMFARAPILFREDAPPPPEPPGSTSESTDDSDLLEREPAWLVCVQCRNRVTRPELAREVQGRFHHVCTNPHGFTFDLGCYSEAPGARPLGPAYAADSWFRGYVWKVAACGGCRAHLGWRFSSGEFAFWGLIRDQLAAEGPAEH